MLWFIADIVYLICIVCSIVIIYKKASFIRSLYWLGVFACICLLAEIITMLLPKGTYNHFVYATGLLLAAITISAYVSNVVKSAKYSVINIAICIAISSVYLINTMWQSTTLIPPYYIAIYYLAYTINMAVFIRLLFKKQQENSLEKNVGYLLFAYHALKSINLSMAYSTTSDVINRSYLFWINEIVDIAFFIYLSYLLIKHKKA